MSECTFCQNEIDWRQIPGKFKTDGTQIAVPVNLDGQDHICKNRKVSGDDWKPRWNIMMKLPVYCFSCSFYYDTKCPCTHLISMGFIPHTSQFNQKTWSLPGRFMEKKMNDMKKLKKNNIDELGKQSKIF